MFGETKKVYFIWIGWIGISAVARYYKQNWCEVFWSDKSDSELIHNLKKEGIQVKIWNTFFEKIDNLALNKVEEQAKLVQRDFKDLDLIVYTEAIPKSHKELEYARKLWIKLFTYPEALADIANSKKLIAVTWSHGKSTTSSLISLILKNSSYNFTSIVWTLLKEFGGKNFYKSLESPIIPFIKEDKHNEENYFVIEACEYKRSFLRYKPFIWVITNIDLDHLDYYKDLEDYISAFASFIWNIREWGYVILNWDCKNSMSLLWIRKDINYIIVSKINSFIPLNKGELKGDFPKINLKIPWEHILFDAKLAYTVWKILEIPDEKIIGSLENYSWVWRRMENIWKTENWNILMSDYGHHPTEISLTLDAIKKFNLEKKLFVVFQPHQYNRTLELLDWFKDCFKSADTIVIPDIYESRDSEEDKKKINSEILISLINHSNKFDWKGLENTLKFIKEYDLENPNSSIILLQWAWNVDDLRYKIKTS